MAAPAIGLGSTDHTGTHRVQMDVGRQFQQVGVGIHENGIIPSLEEMAEPLNPFLDEKIKAIAVRVINENILSVIFTDNEMTQRAGIMNTWFTWHGIEIASI